MEDKKKLPSTFGNLILVMSLISAVSALALAYTYSVTKEPRAMVEVKKTVAALESVLPAFDNNPAEEKYPHPEAQYAEMEFFPAAKGGQRVGWAVKTYSDNGFDSRIWIMVGFDAEKKIYGTQVLAQTETPGLGTKMTADKFRDQFKGKDPVQFQLKVKKDGGQVDALTAATITSRAFCDALDRAFRALEQGGAK